MALINVNFKIVEINEDLGVLLVEYLADGATKERFGSEAGPFIIPIDSSWYSLTDSQLYQEIAKFGVSRVKSQANAINSENLGLTSRLSSLTDQTIATTILE